MKAVLACTENLLFPALRRLKISLALLGCLAWAAVSAPGQTTQPLVAIHDSELTRALETMPAASPTPTGPGTTGFEWWPVNWHYFVMPESLKEALRSDGTAFTVVGDSNVTAGVLLTNGVPTYPIVISLASEAIRDDEIAQFTNYVAAGGFLVVGSSSFTRYTNGASRGNFAFANEMGVSMVNGALTNWANDSTFTRLSNHRLVSHIPDGTLTWRMPTWCEENSWGVSPSHIYLAPHSVWQVQAGTATVLANGDATPYLTVKPYGKGCFIYYAPMQPLIGHGGWAPGMYAYATVRNMIEWAFESARLAVPKLSPWPYEYNATFMVRHDLENFANEITNIEASAQFEASLGAKGDYFFCTGTLRADMAGLYDTNAVIASLQRAMSNYNATIGSHNGGLKNPNNTNLITNDLDYWHWGLDEALNTTPPGYPSGKAYALASLSNSFLDIESWLPGQVTNGLRSWVTPYFTSTREDSYDIQAQLNVKVTGDQKLSPFPSWVLSTATTDKRYGFVSLPVSDWFVGGMIAQSMEAGHNSQSMRDCVDFYYNLGALINLYSHTMSTGLGFSGQLAPDYVTYGMNTNRHPRLWAANAMDVYGWWLQRSNARVNVGFSTNGSRLVTTFAISGSTATNLSVEMVLPGQGAIVGLQVTTNGMPAGADSFRTNGRLVKVLVGTTVTNAAVSYEYIPQAQSDYYQITTGNTLSVPAPGVLGNDLPGFNSASNLVAILASGPAHGVLTLNSNGGFTYTPATNFTGTDSFTYQAGDGSTNSTAVPVVISVLPPAAVFADDFTRPTGADPLVPWRLQMGSAVITNGILQCSSALQNYGYVYLSNSWTDYWIQGHLQFQDGAFGGGLGARLNPVTGAHYAAWVYPENSLGGPLLLKLLKYNDWADWTVMAQMSLGSVGTNVHTLRLTVQGAQISVSFDGTQLISVTDSGSQGAYLSGGIVAGMWTYTNAYSMTVDDVLVTSLTLPPTANNDNYATFKDTALQVSAPGVLGNDTGGSGSVQAVLSAPPSHGTLTLTNNGGFTYMPTNHFVGTDTFTYVGIDGTTNSGMATVSINVLATNRPPVANNDFYPYAVGATQTVSAPGVLSNDTDPDDDTLQATLVSGPAHGTLTLNPDGGFIYTPASGFAGQDSFSYRASDAQTNSTPAIVTLRVPASGIFLSDDFTRATNSGSLDPWVLQSGNWAVSNGLLQGGVNPLQTYASVYLTNAWTNYVVQARLQFPAGAYGGGIGGNLDPATGARYSAWIFPEGSPGGSNVLKLIKFQSWTGWGYLGSLFTPMQQVNLPAVGTNSHTLKLAFQANQIAVYFDGNQVMSVADPEAVTYAGGGVSADMWTDSTGYVMSVDDVVVSPLLLGDSYHVNENTTLTVNAAGVLTNDTDVYGASLMASLVSGPTNGVLNLGADGSFTYKPSANFNGTDTFVYQANDATTNLGMAFVTITVDAVSGPPVLPAQTNRIINELTLLTVTNTATDANAPAGALTYQLLSPPAGAVISTNGIITWTPTEAQGPGTNTITTVVSDNGTPALRATNSFTVTVNEVNSAPVLPAQTNRTINELTLLTVTNTATDSDIPTNTLSYQLLSPPSGVTISTNGVITWTPTEAQGPSTNTITTVVSDNGTPVLRATNSFTVVVNEMNIAPVLPAQTNRTINELTLLTVTNTATDADLPTNTLSYQLLSPPSGVSISTNGVITWTPSEAQGPSTNTITTVVSDNGTPVLRATNSFTVVVNEVNSAPVLPAQTNRTINELTLLTVTNTATDADIPTNMLSYQLLSPPSGATISTNGVITWTPTETQGPSTNTITTVVSDNGTPVLRTTNSFTVVVNEVNTAPVLPAQTNRTITELTLLTVTNTATDADIPANTLSYQLLSPPSGATISTNGVITWTPTEAQGPGTNTITTVVSDNGTPVLRATNSFTVVVNELNTAPVLPVQTNVTVAELTTLIVTNTATDLDLPANSLTYQLLEAPAGASIDTNGVIIWTPGEAQGPGTNVITTVVTDNGVPALSATNSFTVIVNEVNTAPLLPAQTNLVINELALLTVTNTASDADLPANGLSYQLLNPPDGAQIDTNGVITWTPTQFQGGSTNVIMTVVTDDGVPPLSATNSFTVVVERVNVAPVLPVQTNLVIDELTLLTVTNTATDADIPADVLTYQLIDPPAGVSIDTNGVITWTPSEAQGPGTNTITTVVTDNGVPPLSATNSFTVVVNEVNTAPVLPAQTNLTINELTLLTVTNTASDADLPANGLSYQLIDPPAGASIDTNGVITWTPSEAQGPGTYVITTVVSDNGIPSLSATNSFTVVVNEVNSAPVLPVQGNVSVAELSALTITNTATDSDLPANGLTYQLLAPPAGAGIDTNGVITWTPAQGQGGTTNLITTVVTDDGAPPLSATNSFLVVVDNVNFAPVLPAQTNRAIDELALLTVTNTASDPDIPADMLTYQLIDPPAGASIDTNGVITWTPGEAQGPGTNTIVTVVTDNGVPPLSATNSFTVIVNEVNSAPVLPAQTNVTVAELTTLIVTNTATDLDLPANSLTYQLLEAPAGASIDTNGVIIWTPGEAQGPGTNIITTVVTDNGVPALSATNSFTVIVNEVNTAPLLPAQTNLVINELALLTVTNTAGDADLPANGLSYQLLNPPDGAQIDTNGVITWTPTQFQGGSTNVIMTVVTDDGVPPLSATNSFTVVVERVNVAPVLSAQTNVTINELTLLTVTNTATDADVPADVLTYQLIDPPAGASIDTNGVITWTPSEAQGPSTNTITTVAMDSGVPPLSATNSFTVVVNELNTAPVLPAQTNVTVAELTALVVTNTAADSDLPANALSYQLLNPPAGAGIDTNGVITWTSSEAQGPSTNTIVTVVTDNGVPPLSATNSFTVIVNEVNAAPVLPARTNVTINELTLLTVTNTATDLDLPANALNYQLIDPPAGASIDTNGAITWTPSEEQGPGTYVITTVVTDDGIPPLSATNSFTVIVNQVNQPPVLPAQTNFIIDELTLLTVTNTATDADIPADVLSYQLIDPPAGASIDTNGVITWTPSEAQGPSTNTITTVVTDSGVPPLSVTNSFAVVVNEVNSAPVLPAQTNWTIAELSRLVVTNAATDADVPANVLTYQLLDPPTGASIDTNGVITWTPSEAQGPGTNTITTVVTDNGVPSLSVTNSFVVVVEEVNSTPVLPAQTNRTIAELTLLIVTNTAADPDIPVNSLSYQLLDPPNGASIDTNGVITWTPSEAQGPSTNTIVTVVTDDGVPALSATNSFTVIVNEVNSAPILAAQTNRAVNELTLLTVTNTATDADLPANALSYQLINPPAGVSIDTNGVITWTPTEAQGPGTNMITTVVTDNGVPALSATNSFTVVVNEVNTAPVLPVQGDRTIGALSLLVVTNTASDVDLPANVLTYQLLSPPLGATIGSDGVITWTTTLVQAGTTNVFTTVVTDNGVPTLSATNSFVVVVNPVLDTPLPVIQSVSVSAGTARITWSSVVGRFYRLQYTSDLTSGNWVDVTPDMVAIGSTTSTTDALGGASRRFYRIRLLP